jgi:transcriptional antiterminator NusG
MTYTALSSWHAVHTRSRHEKSAYRTLCERGIRAYLPLITVPSSRRDRRAEYDRPLFPGYLFVHIPYERAPDVVTARGVVRILGPRPLEYSAVPEQEIESIRIVIDSRLRLDPFPRLRVGQMVRVTQGMLRGVEGRLVERRGALRIVVAVDLLGQGVSVETRADEVEPV